MRYSNDILRRAKVRLAEEKAAHEARQEARQQQLYNTLPQVKEIDQQLRTSMILAVQAAFAKGNQDALTQVREKNQALQAQRRNLIEEHFPPEYANEGPLCPHCDGTGYIGTAMCICLEALCREEQKKELATLSAGVHTFDEFKLSYYPENPDPKYGVSARAIMTRTFDVCRKYAENFSMDSGNLLFNGGTGLGKTLLSACIARTAAEKGYSVAYESAPHLFGKLEKNHFRPTEESARQAEELSAADLLIIDDLGTEMSGVFVTSALYALVNDRLLEGKPTIISTNLTISEIRERYSPQIASRLQGHYQLLPFVGTDIRIMKNK